MKEQKEIRRQEDMIRRFKQRGTEKLAETGSFQRKTAGCHGRDETVRMQIMEG